MINQSDIKYATAQSEGNGLVAITCGVKVSVSKVYPLDELERRVRDSDRNQREVWDKIYGDVREKVELIYRALDHQIREGYFPHSVPEELLKARRECDDLIASLRYRKE